MHRSLDTEVHIFSTLAQIDTYVCKKTHLTLICGSYAFLRMGSQSHHFPNAIFY